MRYISVFLFVLLAYSVAGAQTLGKFYIGAFWVSGNAVEDDTIRQPNPGPVATYNTSPPPLVSSHLPRSRFDELEELGLNLAGIHFDRNAIVRSAENGQRNVLRDITDDLVSTFTRVDPETNIDVCVFDWGIHDASQLNRVILNPESSWDFEYSTMGSSSHIGFFDFPFHGLTLDRSILEQQQPYNWVLFTSPADTVRGVRFHRKRELTARKNYWGDNQERPNPSRTSNQIAGLYHLSVILADDETDVLNDPDNSTATVLTLRIISTDPMDTSKRVSRDFVVPGNAFYNDPGDPTPRPEPFEYHLGQIEIRIDSFYVRTMDTTEDAWRGCKLTVNDSTSASTANWERTDALVAEQLKYWEDLWFRNFMGNFEIEIIGNSNAHFFVDAVCLSSPAAYGLFASNDVHAGVHSGVHDDVMTRLSAIVSDRNGVGFAPTMRMPLITMKEQSPSGGSWPSERVIGAALADSLPGCLPYSAHGAEVSVEDFGPLLEFQRGMVSGFYTYAVDYNYPRMCEQPIPSDYYDSLYHHNSLPMTRSGRIGDNIVRYRTYAENRALRGINSPWIPFVQNHSNLFERDIAASGAWWDFDNLREPNAAELRLMCNIALAHGADGVMFYQYNTWGGIDITEANACWPRLRSDWVADSMRQIDRNAGSMGFLGANNLPRVCDTNGEDKWDSTRAFITGFLRPVGNRLMDMTWQRSRSWYCGEGESQLVSTIISQRQDALDPIDLSYATFVEMAEYDDSGAKYLFVLNGRALSEGQRHITVKLAPAPDPQDEWLVENVMSGDIWIVRPSKTPDTTSTANGFTEYFPSGAAALYRLEAISNESTTFSFDPDHDTCPDRDIFVEPAATLRLHSTDIVAFGAGNGL